jgi:3-oxoacyl-[acyl-carrier-protein] synthase-3
MRTAAVVLTDVNLTATPPPRGSLVPNTIQPPLLARHARVSGVTILSTGSYTPAVCRTNEELQATLGVDSDWVERRTGIRERRHAPRELATSDLCYAAAVRCLEKASIARSEIDLLIVATVTGDMAVPSTACILQDRLGITCGAFDVQAGCAGFIYALATGAQFVQSGAARRCLVVGGDTASRIIDPTDRETYPLFGDGAGAVLLGPGGCGQGLMAYQLGADGSGAHLLYRAAAGSRFPLTCSPEDEPNRYVHMDGRAVFRWAVQTIGDSTKQLLDYAGVRVADIQLFIPHQANQRLITAIGERIGFPSDRIYSNLHRYGNTIAASVPLALDEAIAQDRIHPGDLLLLTGFGAGLAWGSFLLRL